MNYPSSEQTALTLGAYIPPSASWPDLEIGGRIWSWLCSLARLLVCRRRGTLGRAAPSDQTPYPPEFRREAIKLVLISSKSQHQIAEDPGVSDVTLRNWVKQAEHDEGKRPDGLSTDEREELARLRRENQTLRMEREILKNAAAFSPGKPASRRRAGPRRLDGTHGLRRIHAELRL